MNQKINPLIPTRITTRRTGNLNTASNSVSPQTNSTKIKSKFSPRATRGSVIRNHQTREVLAFDKHDIKGKISPLTYQCNQKIQNSSKQVTLKNNQGGLKTSQRETSCKSPAISRAKQNAQARTKKFGQDFTSINENTEMQNTKKEQDKQDIFGQITELQNNQPTLGSSFKHLHCANSSFQSLKNSIQNINDSKIQLLKLNDGNDTNIPIPLPTFAPSHLKAQNHENQLSNILTSIQQKEKLNIQKQGNLAEQKKQSNCFGNEFIAAIQQINFSELSNLKKEKVKQNDQDKKVQRSKENSSVRIDQQKSKKQKNQNMNSQNQNQQKSVGIIPPYTTNNSSFDKINPYQKYQDQLNLEGVRMSDQRNQKNNGNQFLNFEQLQSKQIQNYNSILSVHSGSIKRPKISKNFYINAKQLQNARQAIQPFLQQNKQACILNESDIVKQKLLKLIGKKRRFSEIDKSIITKYSNKYDCDNNKEINEFQNQIMGPPEDNSSKIDKNNLKNNRPGKQSVKVQRYDNLCNKFTKCTPEQIKCNQQMGIQSADQKVFNLQDQQIQQPNPENIEKFTNSVKSFVGGMLCQNKDISTDGQIKKYNFLKNVEQMNENMKLLQTPQIQKITGFAQQIQAVQEFNKQIQSKNDTCDDYKQDFSSSQFELSKCQNLQFGQLPEDKLEFLKKFPQQQLVQWGYGDLALNETKSEDFLSESSLEDSDFSLLMNNNFFDIVKQMEGEIVNKSVDSNKQKSALEENENKSCNSINSSSILNLKLPVFDNNIHYDSEFYQLFIKNQQLLEDIENQARERTDIMEKIYRIQDFYDQNVSKMTIDRDEKGRKIHKRKTMAELERDFTCPYDSCGKVYASEGSLNLHIKRKHNGGNKTDREKIAKSLLICQAKGIKVGDNLDVNLPPGIIKKVAEQIEQQNNFKVNQDIVKVLETKIQIQNKIDEKRMKEMELAKAQEESQRAKAMVEQLQCTPPKKSKILERYMNLKQDFNNHKRDDKSDNTITEDFKEPQNILKKVQKTQNNEFVNFHTKNSSEILGDITQQTLNSGYFEEAYQRPCLSKEFSFQNQQAEQKNPLQLQKGKSKADRKISQQVDKENRDYKEKLQQY